MNLSNYVCVNIRGSIWWPGVKICENDDFFTVYDEAVTTIKLLGVEKNICVSNQSHGSTWRAGDHCSFNLVQDIPADLHSYYERAKHEWKDIFASNLALSANPVIVDDVTTSVLASDILSKKRKAATLSADIRLPKKESSEITVCEDCFEISLKSKKRADAIIWDDYFMAVAFLSAMRSKDPSTQVGACIVNTDNRIVGIGYNGFPRGCSDDELPWDRSAASELDTKYLYVCHAEVNAVLNKNSADVKGCTIYVALFPCHECTKVIIQSGISEVVFLSDKYKDTPSMQASRRMLTMAGVTLRHHNPSRDSIQINFADKPSVLAALQTSDPETIA